MTVVAWHSTLSPFTFELETSVRHCSFLDIIVCHSFINLSCTVQAVLYQSKKQNCCVWSIWDQFWPQIGAARFFRENSIDPISRPVNFRDCEDEKSHCVWNTRSCTKGSRSRIFWLDLIARVRSSRSWSKMCLYLLRLRRLLQPWMQDSNSK